MQCPDGAEFSKDELKVRYITVITVILIRHLSLHNHHMWCCSANVHQALILNCTSASVLWASNVQCRHHARMLPLQISASQGCSWQPFHSCTTALTVPVISRLLPLPVGLQHRHCRC
jgi:hypothetical protein